MLQIPIRAVPSQTVYSVLGNQNCQINIYSIGEEDTLFFDINSNGVDVVNCVIARDIDPVVCIQYTGFQGNLFFIDTQGNEDPQYAGLGSRWQLIYLTAAEYALFQQ